MRRPSRAGSLQRLRPRPYSAAAAATLANPSRCFRYVHRARWHGVPGTAPCPCRNTSTNAASCGSAFGRAQRQWCRPIRAGIYRAPCRTAAPFSSLRALNSGCYLLISTFTVAHSITPSGPAGYESTHWGPIGAVPSSKDGGQGLRRGLQWHYVRDQGGASRRGRRIRSLELMPQHAPTSDPPPGVRSDRKAGRPPGRMAVATARLTQGHHLAT